MPYEVKDPRLIRAAELARAAIKGILDRTLTPEQGLCTRNASCMHSMGRSTAEDKDSPQGQPA